MGSPKLKPCLEIVPLVPVCWDLTSVTVSIKSINWEKQKNLKFGVYGVTYFTIVCHKFSGVPGSVGGVSLRPL